MSKVLITDTYLTNIANAIRSKAGTEDTFKPGEMATAIESIESGGGSVPTKGFVVNEWNEDGYATDISIVGMTAIPDSYFRYAGYGDNTYGDAGWAYSTGLRINLPNGLTSIGDSSFYDNHALVSINLPDSLTSIGDHAFCSCKNIESLELPNSLTLIKSYAFSGCSKLNLTELPSNLTEIKDATFNKCGKLNLTELPSNLTSIGSYAFGYCSNLSLTELPSGLTSIGNTAFEYCSKLNLTEIPSGVTSLNYDTFRNCSNLKELVCQGALTSISDEVFSGCEKLIKLVLPNITIVPSLSNVDAFKKTPIENGTGYIYVPDALVDSFKSATNWSTYADQIKPISDLNIQSIEIVCADLINTCNNNNTMNINVTYNGGQTLVYPPEQEGYTLSVSGNATLDGNILTLTDEAQAGDIITITVTSTYDNSISSTKEIEVIYREPSISVNLNEGQWVDSGTRIDGNIVYKSDVGSYNINNGKSTAILTVDGYTNVKLYIRSYAESTYDYTEAFAIDTPATRGNGLFTTKANNSATDYVECIYNLDSGTHTIDIMYSKDSSGDKYSDRGYFYIGECS